MQVAEGRTGNWTLGGQKGGVLSRKALRGHGRLLVDSFPFCPLRALGLGSGGGWREGGLGRGGLLALASKETQELESEEGV